MSFQSLANLEKKCENGKENWDPLTEIVTSQVGLLLIQYLNQMSFRRYWSESSKIWYTYETRWEELQNIKYFVAMATFLVRAFINWKHNCLIFYSPVGPQWAGWPQTWKTWKTQGIWKLVKISWKSRGILNFCRKNLENSGKITNMGHDRQQKCISLNFPLLSCSGKNLKMTWKSQGKLREFSFSKMWPLWWGFSCFWYALALADQLLTDCNRLKLFTS